MEILLATKNKNKFIELKNIFDQSNSEHELLFYQDLIEVEEDKETIFDNAKKKAIEVYKEYEKPVISDDSGLFVDSLNGEPGVKSARYAGEQATDQDNIEKLITKAKTDNLSNRRYVMSKLFNNKEACQKLFSEISIQQKNRNGGYTRIIKKGNRFGDFAHTSIIQIVK